jgi:hypothetical protein
MWILKKVIRFLERQLDCALGSEFISENSRNRPELRPSSYGHIHTFHLPTTKGGLSRGGVGLHFWDCISILLQH